MAFLADNDVVEDAESTNLGVFRELAVSEVVVARPEVAAEEVTGDDDRGGSIGYNVGEGFIATDLASRPTSPGNADKPAIGQPPFRAKS